MNIGPTTETILVLARMSAMGCLHMAQGHPVDETVLPSKVHGHHHLARIVRVHVNHHLASENGGERL